MKNIVNLLKYKITSPEYLLIDLKSDASSEDPPKKVGYLIVYGIVGTRSFVPSSVYDKVMAFFKNEINFFTMFV